MFCSELYIKTNGNFPSQHIRSWSEGKTHENEYSPIWGSKSDIHTRAQNPMCELAFGSSSDLGTPIGAAYKTNLVSATVSWASSNIMKQYHVH